MAGGPSPARAEVSADINIRLGNRPAPVVVFDEEPEVVLVPRSRVYYVEHRGYDLYRYGRYWYINDSGYWFRAASYRGPFVGIELRHVPRSITVVPGALSPTTRRTRTAAPRGSSRTSGSWCSMTTRERGSGRDRGREVEGPEGPQGRLGFQRFESERMARCGAGHPRGARRSLSRRAPS